MCSFCGKEFRSLGRHSWRCKEKIKRSDNEQTTSDKASQQEELDSTNEKECVSSISKSSPVKCCCGKTCNGLKLHHRSCRVVQGLGDISVKDIHVDSNDNNGVDNLVPTNVTNIMPVIKPGIKLPKTDSQWKTANDYLRAMLPMSMIDPKNIGDSILKMNEVLYNYFKNTYGIVDTIYQATWKDKYMTRHIGQKSVFKYIVSI